MGWRNFRRWLVSLPQKLPLHLLQTQWAAKLDPLISNQLTQGLLLSQALINGVTTFNHKLGRQMVGWILTDQDSSADIYRSAPLNSQTLTLTSSAAVTVSLWVF